MTGITEGDDTAPAPALRPGAESPAPALRPGAESPAPALRPGAESPAPALRPGAESPAPALRPGAESPAPALRPGDWRLAAWRDFLRTHNHLMRLLEQDLQASGKIPLGSYDVLVQLAEAPDRRLRMSELAEAVLLSRSGLSRLVDRLQKDGLVQREPDPLDARGMFTVLTDKGLDTLRDAAAVHLGGVVRLVTSRLDDDELRQLAGLMAKLDPTPLAAGGAGCGC